MINRIKLVMTLALLLLAGSVLAQDEDFYPEAPEIEEEEVLHDQIYEWSSTEPEFKGGKTALNQFIVEHFRIPGDVQDSGLSVRFFVQFVVDTLGCVSDAEVVRQQLPESLKQAGIDVVEKMRCNWKPGMISGKPVKIRMRLPIHVRFD
ncbi:MAG: energy transducer TonB [Bacteroidia bacterium]|nr:energy transducer TonB [Bacteroidia bacterium]